MTTTRPEAAPPARILRSSASGLALLTIASAAHAATTAAVTPAPLQPTLFVGAVATDNARLGGPGDERKDLVGETDAGLIVRSVGPRVTLTGNLGAEFIGYARHSEPDAVLPRGHLDLSSTLVDRALFFDGEAAADRTRSDPLAAQSDSFSTANTVSTTRLRASPYFAHDFSDTLSALARSDTTITRNRAVDPSAGPAPAGSTYQHDTFEIVRKPAPLGVSIKGSREDTLSQDRTAPPLKSDTLQAMLTAQVDEDVQLGVIGGREHVRHDGLVDDGNIYGGMLQWRPSRRLDLELDAQHHYFGNGFALHLKDRLPRTAVDLAMSRAVTASVAAFGSYNVDSDPTALLGAILSSRTPDAPQNDQAAEQLAQAEGLPASFSQPTSIMSSRAQLVTRAQLNLVFDGPRDTVYASSWYQKAVALADAPAVPATITNIDTRQWGGSLGFYHRLTPTLSAAAEAQWSTTDALSDRAGDHQHQASGTLSLTQRLGPHTTLSGGARHFSARTALASTATTTQVRENQAFVGLRMQY